MSSEDCVTAYALTKEDNPTFKNFLSKDKMPPAAPKKRSFIVFFDPQEVPHAEKLYTLKAGQHRIKALTLLLKNEAARGCDPELLGIL